MNANGTHTVALWLPGDFPTTNKLLDVQRATGFYEGVNRVRGGKPPKVTFGKIVKAIRDQTNMTARARRLGPLGHPVRLIFVHLGSGRRDPSSWYLAAKAIEDGLVDAGVIGSDRFGVVYTAGRSVSMLDTRWLDHVAEVTGIRPQGEGMLVVMRPEEFDDGRG